MTMNIEDIDYAITGGKTAITNCFVFGYCVYCYVPERSEYIWVSEHDETKYLAMINRLRSLGNAYATKEELKAALQCHPILSAYANHILRYL
jgi:hypothetical protein